MNRIGLTGLVKIELPGRTLRFCDGGFFEYQGETYTSEDDVFGTIGSLQTMAESVGDIVPAVVMTLLPPNTTAAEDISQPGNQRSAVQFIIAEYDADTGLISTGAVEFYGQLDQTVLRSRDDEYSLAVSVVSLAERLFERNIGNSMNSSWHKSVWPDELGQDNATGLTGSIAWGVESAGGRGVVGAGGGFGGAGFGAGGNNDSINRVAQ